MAPPTCFHPTRVAWAIAVCVVCVGCPDNPPDPTTRYAGSLDPCSVTYDGDAPGVELRDLPVDDDGVPKLWEPGPYPTWNTAPDSWCRWSPTIDFVGTEQVEQPDGEVVDVEHRNVAMYMTYPARSEPTITGDGRVADGEFPVVVFAHANHDRRCDIHEGYWSLHDHWASWGFVVAAVDGTALNCSPGTRQNIRLRSQGQLAALDALRDLNENPDSPFAGHLDLDRIIFAGHSRGGGAALLSQRAYPQSLGVIDLQGIDLTAFGFGRAPLPDVPVLGMTAGHDVDLNFPVVEPTEDQLSGEYTWVNINGGIHAYTADGSPLEFDDHPGIGREQQHDIIELYTTALLGRLAGLPVRGDDYRTFLPVTWDTLYSTRGARTVVSSISPTGVFQRWREDTRAVWIDDFDSPIDDQDPQTNLRGGENRSRGLQRSEEVATYRPDETPGAGPFSKAWSRLLAADSPGTFTAFLAADEAPVDVIVTPELMFRVRGPDQGERAVTSVELVTKSGNATVALADHRGPVELENRFAQVVIEPEAWGGDVDLERVVAVRLHVEGGALFVDDLRFTE